MRLNITRAALAASVAFATPATAQTVIKDTELAEARGTVLLPLSLTKNRDLDFGTVLASGTAGTVTVDANNGTRSVGGAGGVSLVALNPGGRAVFTAVGTANQSVDLTLTPPTGNVLNGPSGAQIAVSALGLDGLGGMTATRNLGTGGTLLIGVGGTFDIAANQANGLYTAQFSLTAEYK
ncbi:DUF4402 domain-containing protein [Sphingomonas sp. GCM10030256]|uniref:DUF4402 domain-containing protein n=1 Tax=Sphingomonas sp. GCM10030256 TaxID=3273427 RepID=UPI003612F1A4